MVYQTLLVHLKKALFLFRINCLLTTEEIFLEIREFVKQIYKANIGNEIHFLYECTRLNDLRVKYMSSCIRLIPNVVLY